MSICIVEIVFLLYLVINYYITFIANILYNNISDVIESAECVLGDFKKRISVWLLEDKEDIEEPFMSQFFTSSYPNGRLISVLLQKGGPTVFGRGLYRLWSQQKAYLYLDIC